MILRTSERLDPLGHAEVLLSSFSPWDLSVRDVTDEDVLERILRLALDRAATGTLHELLLPQNVELLLRRPERSEPEDLSDHRSVLQQRLLLRRERVEA